MGTVVSRQTGLCSTLSRQNVKEVKDTRQPYRVLQPPVPIQRSDSEVRKRYVNAEGNPEKDLMESSTMGGSPNSQMMPEPKDYQMPSSSRKESGYIQLATEEPADFDTMVERGRCSQDMMDWAQSWMEKAEGGELDIFTCLGLSNACTCTEDTRKYLAKVIGVCILQLVIPCILLHIQVAEGFSFFPKQSSPLFRIMGCSLYLYSLYSMYNNALDECRSSQLQWCIDRKAPFGYWWPLLLGEFSNVFVSLILVSTLFVIFTDVEQAADLILNAVAVNFLGAVDGEFVDDEMRKEAIQNFRKMFMDYGQDMLDSPEQRSQKSTNILHYALNGTLGLVVIQGCILAGVFLFAPSKGPHISLKMGSASGTGRGLEDYPRFV